MTDRFVRSAQVVAQVNGLPDYPFAVIGHPVANDDDAALRAAHTAGRPVVARAHDTTGVTAALARPEVSCVLVTDPALLELDLPELTYG